MQRMVVTAQNGLRIRSGPTTASRTLTVAPRGAALLVDMSRAVGRWQRVVSPIIGYAWDEFLVPAAAETDFMFTHWPVNSRIITQRYGDNPQYYKQFGLPGHEGIDFRASHGEPVYAVAPGTIKTIINERLPKRQGGHNYGVHIRISHAQGYETIYAHLHCYGIAVGQQVAGGQVIGLADNTGNSFGSHLHLTLKHNGRIIDPTPFLHNTT